jgi:hypothetical protein
MARRRSTREFPECGSDPSLACLERGVSRNIREADTCEDVKHAQRQAQFLESLGRFGKLDFTEGEARQANRRLHRKACSRQGELCDQKTPSCRR